HFVVRKLTDQLPPNQKARPHLEEDVILISPESNLAFVSGGKPLELAERFTRDQRVNAASSAHTTFGAPLDESKAVTIR
ncbi:hypothetical protein WAI05_23615, partial [Acinetobacter baumannii]